MNDGVIFVKVDHTSFVPSSDRGFVGFFAVDERLPTSATLIRRPTRWSIR